MSSSLFSIIPAKPLTQAKTRLAAVLSLKERIDLSYRLLQHTISLALQVGEVVVVSRDGRVRQLAKQAGAWAIVEAGTTMNEALRQASAWVTTRGAQAILILPGDLPLLTVSDLRQIIEMAEPQTPAMVVAPCHRLDGTNALFLRPPGLIDFGFGVGSFERHQQAARARGLEPIIYRSPTIALDLDLPEDLSAWRLKDNRLRISG